MLWCVSIVWEKFRILYTDLLSLGKIRVAIDRGTHFFSYIFSLFLISFLALPLGLRLADKRSLPCPNRLKWLEARDELYEEIMVKAWNKEGKYFGQTYEDTSALDSCVLIMPLVFFMPAVSFITWTFFLYKSWIYLPPQSDPRFLGTLKQVLKTPEKGGLTSNVRLFTLFLGTSLTSF